MEDYKVTAVIAITAVILMFAVDRAYNIYGDSYAQPSAAVAAVATVTQQAPVPIAAAVAKKPILAVIEKPAIQAETVAEAEQFDADVAECSTLQVVQGATARGQYDNPDINNPHECVELNLTHLRSLMAQGIATQAEINAVANAVNLGY